MMGLYNENQEAQGLAVRYGLTKTSVRTLSQWEEAQETLSFRLREG